MIFIVLSYKQKILERITIEDNVELPKIEKYIIIIVSQSLNFQVKLERLLTHNILTDTYSIWNFS